LIERMEQDGKVSRPDHVGRREVLIDTTGEPI
jgi:S-DNA-T family DNA segregation ATPase FtsK/SpoIIIE